MRAFRVGLPHREAMRKLPYWCDEGSYAHWKCNDLAMPSWKEAAEKLSGSGELSRCFIRHRIRRQDGSPPVERAAKNPKARLFAGAYETSMK